MALPDEEPQQEAFVEKRSLPFWGESGSTLGVGDYASPEYRARQASEGVAGGKILGGEPVAVGPGSDAQALGNQKEGFYEVPDYAGYLDDEPGWASSMAPEAPKKGGGVKGQGGYIETEVSPAGDPRLVAAQMAYAGRLADWRHLDLMARADAMGLVADTYKDFGHLQQEAYDATMKKSGELLAMAEREQGAIHDLVTAARSNRINPGEFFANVGDAGKFSAAIAVGAGAMASAFGGGPNVAQQVIGAAIDRNVRAQMVNQEHDRAMIAHQTNFVNSIRGLAMDQAQYGNFLRIGLTAIAQARIAEIQAGYAAVQNKIGAQAVYDQLGAQLVEAQMRALENTKYKLHVGYQTLRQLSHAAGATMNAAAMIQSRQAAPAAASQGAAGAPRRPANAQGGTRGAPSGLPPSAAPQRGAPTGRGASPGGIGAKAKAIARQMNENWDSMAPSEQARLVADLIAEEANATGVMPTRKDMESALADEAGGARSAFGQEFISIPETDFKPRGGKGALTIYTGGARNKTLTLRNQEAWDSLGVAEQGKVRAAMTSSLGGLHLTRELFSTVGKISQGKGLSGKLLRRGPNGELAVPIMGTTNETKAIQRLNALRLHLADIKRTEKGQDAIRNLSEFGIWERLTSGDEITNLDEVVDLIRNDPQVRQAKIAPFVDFAVDRFLQNATPYFDIPDEFLEARARAQ